MNENNKNLWIKNLWARHESQRRLTKITQLLFLKKYLPEKDASTGSTVVGMRYTSPSRLTVQLALFIKSNLILNTNCNTIYLITYWLVFFLGFFNIEINFSRIESRQPLLTLRADSLFLPWQQHDWEQTTSPYLDNIMIESRLPLLTLAALWLRADYLSLPWQQNEWEQTNSPYLESIMTESRQPRSSYLDSSMIESRRPLHKSGTLKELETRRLKKKSNHKWMKRRLKENMKIRNPKPAKGTNGKMTDGWKRPESVHRVSSYISVFSPLDSDFVISP